MSNYKFAMNDETNVIFIELEDEKYKGVIAKAGHIQYNQSNELEFDMELPEGKESYYDDEYFIEQIQNAVFDIVAKAVNSYWNEAEQAILTDLESKVKKAMSQYNIKLEEGKSFIEMFGEKGYVITEDENDNDRLMAVNPTNEETYYFDVKDDLSYLRNIITGGKLIL